MEKFYGKILLLNLFDLCAPLSLEFTKETIEHVKVTFQQIEEDIKNLAPYQTNTGDELQVNISSLFFPTLNDEKILNFLLDNKSSQSCPICKSTPKHFNNLLNFDNDQFKPKGDSSLIYGCQPLHATINTLNCLLNLSYRKKLELWQVKGEGNKKALAEEKDRVRHKVEDFFKIKIDRPCQGGQENTTTGNLCRRLFSKPRDSSKILELDDELVSNLSTILAALNCHEHLDFEKFGSCHDTYSLFISKYKWFNMPLFIKFFVNQNTLL